MINVRSLTTSFFTFIAFALFVTLSASSVSAQTHGPVGPYQLRAFSGDQAGTVTLVWQDNDTVNNYDVAYGTSSGNYTWGAQNIGNTATYTVTGLTNGQQYYFVIHPKNDGGGSYSGAFTAEVSAVAGTNNNVNPNIATYQAATPTFTTGPVSPPYNLIAEPGPGRGQITLRWQMNMNNVNDYDVVYGLQRNTFIYGGQELGNTNVYVVSHLQPGVQYYFALHLESGNTSLGYTQEVAAIAAR